MDGRRQQARELRRQIEWTLARAMDPTDVLPMLHRLARLADDGSDESVYANLHLAELLVERDPWRAALCARRVLAQRPADDRVWATLALCQTLLGNYRFAVSAYHHALSSAPDNPWYAHNLGHLLDVALGRARDALPWLERAYRTAGSSGELSASYAHALARVGRLAQARRVLARAMRRTASREHTALLRWLEQGAPPDKDHPLPRPAPFHTMELTDRAGDERADAGRAGKVRRESADGPEGSPSAGASGPAVATVDDEARGREPRRSALLADLDEVLARGLASLPLDAKQRARAKSLARDALTRFTRPTAKNATAVQSVAAAVAYAIVYVDHVPLTQSEVAACFRVSVASLRGRFGELRAHLDLTPGDARYATLRRR
ncbi:MAG: tetratricopeptide repeat protein [Myxococcales bacterium]|nr:tetratricopeptide repeat protein [Myxococcales bacterium]